jgi:hypothetical protein
MRWGRSQISLIVGEARARVSIPIDLASLPRQQNCRNALRLLEPTLRTFNTEMISQPAAAIAETVIEFAHIASHSAASSR